MTVRPATSDDISELVRLREVLAARMAADQPGRVQSDDWQDGYARSLAERLGRPDVVVFVIDQPTGGGLAACGIGFIYERFPGPSQPDGRFGYVLGMTTDPGFRRLGHGRAIMAALIGWYRANGIRRVDLHATPDGEPLYREYGFTSYYPGLSWVDREPARP